MSIEKSNKLMKDQKGEKIFSTALLLNFSPFENSFRELSDGIENVRLNTSASAIQGEGTQMINNLLTNDLLEGMDCSSPYHKNKNSNEEKVGDIILDNCDNDSALHSSEEEHSDDEEIISNHSNSQEKDESNNILKEMGKQKNKMNSSSKLPNDSKHNSNNMLMMNNNKGGIGHFANKPPEYLYSYYGGTSKYLSKTFMNGNQNKAEMNYNKELYPLPQNTNGMNPVMGINNKDLYGNYVNELMYHQQFNNYPFGYYNNMNMNMNMNQQLYQNYNNRNTNKQMCSQMPEDFNYQLNKSNQQTSFQPSGIKNYYHYMGMTEANDFFPQQFTTNANANANINANNNNSNEGGQKKGVKAEIGTSNTQLPQQSNNSSNAFNPKKKKKKEKKGKKNDEYLIEMFGRIGWICDQCNNFNYESKNTIEITF